MVEPVEWAAAPTPCNEAIEAIQLLTAVEFRDDADGPRPRAEDPRYGLQAGRTALSTRTARETKTTTLWFGADGRHGEEPVVHACRADEPDTVALVPVGPVAVLRRPWVDYVSKRVLSQSAIVERLDLAHRDGRARSFRVEDGRWRLVGAEGARPEVGEFAQDELRDLVGSKVVDARGARYDAPDWTVRLLRANGDELGALRVFEEAADRPLAVQAGARAPVAFELSTRQSRELRALWQ